MCSEKIIKRKFVYIKDSFYPNVIKMVNKGQLNNIIKNLFMIFMVDVFSAWQRNKNSCKLNGQHDKYTKYSRLQIIPRSVTFLN